MPVLNHHIVACADKEATARFFAEILGLERRLPYWSDPRHRDVGHINHWDDGRGVYFADPNGHSLEILTRPYGSAGTEARHPHPLAGD